MRGMIYCVHLFGVGHLKRMLTLAKGLVEQGMKITLIQAGRLEYLTFSHPNFTHIRLPFHEEMMLPFARGDASRMSLFSDYMKIRRKKLFSLLDFSQPYDFLITEQIPFSKIAFLYEAYSIKEAIKVVNPRFAMICSQKGGGAPLIEQHSLNTLKELQNHYDKILVHCDPKICTLEEMFSYCELVREKIEYTGYIFPQSKKKISASQRKKWILVTNGSGNKGSHLLKMLASIASQMPEYRFIFIASPMMENALLDLLQEASKKYTNIAVVGFLDNFDEQLRHCELAITLAGSTLVNLYATGTPGLVYADPGDSGQEMLGAKFAKLGLVKLIHEGDLAQESLKNMLLETLAHPPRADIELNIAGVENSLRAIRQIVAFNRSLV